MADENYKPDYIEIVLPQEDAVERRRRVMACDGADVLVRVRGKGKGYWRGNIEVEEGLCHLTRGSSEDFVFWPENVASLYVRA